MYYLNVYKHLQNCRRMELLVLFVIVFISILLLHTFVVLLCYAFRKDIDSIMSYWRGFIDRNDGLFNLVFIGIFAVEQAVLLVLIFEYGPNVEVLGLIVSIFALVVVTTASIQKVILDIKRKYEQRRYQAMAQLGAKSEQILEHFSGILK